MSWSSGFHLSTHLTVNMAQKYSDTNTVWAEGILIVKWCTVLLFFASAGAARLFCIFTYLFFINSIYVLFLILRDSQTEFHCTL